MRPVVLALALAGCLLPAPGIDLHEALLAPTHYAAVIVELDTDGARPDPAAWEAFVTALADATGKEVVQPPPGSIPPHPAVLERTDLERLHEATADHRPGPDRLHGGAGAAYLHVLYLSGRLATDTPEEATGGTLSRLRGLMVVLPDAFAGAMRHEDGRLVPAHAELERTVLLHELGHAFGLVDRGLPMQVPREDPFHDGHSSNRNSVMHHGTVIGAGGVLRDPIPPGFDAYDLLDIRAYRARWQDAA